MYIYLYFFHVQNAVQKLYNVLFCFLSIGQSVFLFSFFYVVVKIHIFVLHVITILYTQFVFSSMENNKVRLVM